MQKTDELMLPPPPNRAGFTIAISGDKILLDFGAPTFGYTMTTEQALKLAKTLRDKAREIRRSKHAKKR